MSGVVKYQTFWEFISVETSLVDRGIFFFPYLLSLEGLKGFRLRGSNRFVLILCLRGLRLRDSLLFWEGG